MSEEERELQEDYEGISGEWKGGDQQRWCEGERDPQAALKASESRETRRERPAALRSSEAGPVCKGPSWRHCESFTLHVWVRYTLKPSDTNCMGTNTESEYI